MNKVFDKILEYALKKEKENILTKIIIFLKISTISIGSAFLLLLSISTFLLIYSSAEPTISPTISFTSYNILKIALLLLVIAIGAAVTLLPHNKSWNFRIWGLTVALGMTFTILILMGAWGSTSGAIMRVLKLGSIKEANIVVDKTGCQMLAAQGIAINCETSSNAYLIKNVYVLWRVGEYVIRFNGEKIIFPSSHVLSLSIKEKKADAS